MLTKATERILQRMDRMGFAGAGEALREIARLRDVIDRAAQAWLSLDPPLQWEGDVGDAMVAAVADIKRLRSTNMADLVYPPFGESFTMPTSEIDWQWIRDNCVIVRASTLDERDAEIKRLRVAIAERDEELRSLRLIIANKDARFQRVREALGEQ